MNVLLYLFWGCIAFIVLASAFLCGKTVWDTITAPFRKINADRKSALADKQTASTQKADAAALRRELAPKTLAGKQADLKRRYDR